MRERDEKPAEAGESVPPDELIDRGNRGYQDRAMKPEFVREDRGGRSGRYVPKDR